MIDSHVHIWSADVRAYPWGPHDQVAPPSIRASLERLRHEMDAAGVSGAVAIQPRVYGYDHAYLQSALSAAEGRIAGVCLVNPVRPGAALELRQRLAEGFTGLRLTALDQPDAGWLVGPESRALWDVLAELRVPVSFLIDPDHLGVVATAAERYEAVPIVIDHLARCRPDQSIYHATLVNLARFPNVHVKLSAVDALSSQGFPHRDMWPVIQRCVDAFGPERLMWGTDFPHVLSYGPYGWALDAIHTLLATLSGPELTAVTGGTAARIYGLELAGPDPSV